MRFVLDVVPGLVLLYVTFLLGQVNQRRKYKDRRDPLPVIQAARGVLTERNIRGDGGISNAVAGTLQLALDEWDLHPQ